MAQKVDLQERLKMRFLTVDYDGKSERYAGHTNDAGTIAKDVLNIPDYILEELLAKELPGLERKHADCGLLIYDMNNQDAHSGASGCGTSASVLACHFLPMLKRGELRRILFLSTGALMSPSSLLQGENIYGIAPLIRLEGGRK